MVAGPAAAHAVALAKRLPTLRVGLHLALVEAAPASRPQDIPDLVDSDGQLRRDMVRLAFAIALRGGVHGQLRREIAAQFRAFRRTGLTLDHVNAHKHFHVHPLIARDVLSIGRDYGMNALRVPAEPAQIVARIDNKPPAFSERVMAPWTTALRGWARARRPDDARRRVRPALDRRRHCRASRRFATPAAGRAGRNLYAPGDARRLSRPRAGLHYAGELKALTDPEVIAAVKRSGRRLGGYADGCHLDPLIAAQRSAWLRSALEG